MAEVINPAIVPKVTLPSGEQVPCVGMGTFGSDRVSAEDVSAAVAGAIRSGYRMFDCAACYGNEHEIGQVFKDAFDEGVVERKDLFIMTKVWNDMHRRVEEACDKSIRDLQCDYVDMYYIHWPFPNYHAPGCDVDSRNPDSKPFSVEEFMDTYRQCEALVEKGKMTQEAVDAIVAKITPGLKEDLCADCDLIVEAAFENMEVKKTTFGELDKICKPECVFASNTSSLSITEIGNGLTRPLIGMHFFNPADRMKLVEVIAGVNTPAETVDTIKKISEEIGKTPVQVNEAAGFVVNRILIPMINEAAFIKMEGVSDIAGIDAAMKLGANHPMGPLELGDFVGLDICLAIMDVLYNETGDSKYRACPLIRKMVRGGNLGVKTGKGFYVYNADRTKTPVDAQ